MRQFLAITVLASLVGIGLAGEAQAQVLVRAPFVRVWVDGPNVQVRAPFVNFATGGYYYYAPPRIVYVSPPRVLEQLPPPNPEFAPPAPKPAENPDVTPPEPLDPKTKALTLAEFAKTFTAKAGNYEVTLQNPLTNEPTTVRFTLPEGTPRRVHVRRSDIEFDYGGRHFVRIEFDRDGVQVVSR